VEPHEAAAGLYQVAEDGQPEAKVHGSWSEMPSLFHAMADEPMPLLYGNVFGKSVTLVDCRVTSSKRGLSVLQDTTITPRMAVEGLWLEPKELAFTELSVQFWDQDVWTQWDSYRGVVSASTDDFGLTVTYERPEAKVAELPQATVTLTDASTYDQTTHPGGWSLKSISRFRIHFSEPIGVEDVFNRWLVPLEFLIMSATGRSSGISALTATNSTWEIANERHRADRWVEVRTSYPPRFGKEKESHDLLHLARDFDFGRQIPRVVEVVNQHRYSVEHFAALKGRPSGGVLARFVAAAQLVESFDRTLHDDQPKPGQAAVMEQVTKLLKDTGISSKYRRKIKDVLKRSHEPSLEQRLRRLSRQSGSVLDEVVEHTRWPADVARLRNIVVHGLETSETLTRDVRSIQVSTDILLLLFEARWLWEIGFDQAQIRRLLERRAYHWSIKHRIRENYPHLAQIAARHPEV
jgi:hypothetical protein